VCPAAAWRVTRNALLRAAAAYGGGGQSLDTASAFRLLRALNAFATRTLALAQPGALLLVARAIVDAESTPGPDAKAALCEALL
jgi:hypothetical protein